MKVRVLERWIADAQRAREAREHLRSLARSLALRRLLRAETDPVPGQRRPE